MARIVFCLALLAAFAVPAAAQTGRISGTITDQSGAVLPGVEVRALLRDAAGETTRSVVTDGKGAYELGALLPGSWVVTASLPGFETANQRSAVQAGDSLDWNPSLELGMIQETITVTTDPPQGPLRTEIGRRDAPGVPRQPGGASAARVGGSVKPPVKVVHVTPVYPADAAAQRVGGVVILNAIIGSDGIVREVKSLRSPDESLTVAATTALTGWEFMPTLLNGVPVETRITATFNFNAQPPSR